MRPLYLKNVTVITKCDVITNFDSTDRKNMLYFIQSQIFAILDGRSVIFSTKNNIPLTTRTENI